MTASDDLTSNPNYQFCKQLCESMDTQALKEVVSNREKTVEVVKQNVEPEKVNDQEYIDSVVNEMQNVASEILEKRSQN